MRINSFCQNRNLKHRNTSLILFLLIFSSHITFSQNPFVKNVNQYFFDVHIKNVSPIKAIRNFRQNKFLNEGDIVQSDSAIYSSFLNTKEKTTKKIYNFSVISSPLEYLNFDSASIQIETFESKSYSKLGEPKWFAYFHNFTEAKINFQKIVKQFTSISSNFILEPAGSFQDVQIARFSTFYAYPNEVKDITFTLCRNQELNVYEIQLVLNNDLDNTTNSLKRNHVRNAQLWDNKFFRSWLGGIADKILMLR